ncbi:MAG TPA: hypothetical protein VLW45_10715 [Pelomicrobium sp.]|nr:hypothetical protein [Pelomicrobium sp.]
MPDRESLLRYLEERLEGALPRGQKAVFHYLDGKVEAEIYLDRKARADPIQVAALRRRLDALLESDPYFRSIQLRGLDAQQ